MPSIPRSVTRCGRECAAIILVCLGLIGALWLVTSDRIGYEHELAVAGAVKHNTNLALALEEHTVGALKAAEQVLLFTKYQWEADHQLVTTAALQAEGAIDARFVTALGVVDPDGYVLLADGHPGAVNVADRDYFIFHRDFPDDWTRIGRPVAGRISGRTAITLSRRITRADGSFGGVYFVGVDPTYFMRAYERFDVGSRGVVQLVGLDGTARARRASGRSSFGDDMRYGTLLRQAIRAPIGSFVSVGRLEGIARYQSYRSLSEYPLVVSVGTAVDEALADFHGQERRYYLTGIAGTALLAAFAAALLVATLRRRRTMQALASSAELHRATFSQAAVGITHTALDGTLLRVNPKFCELMGYAEGELVGRNFLDLTHGDDRARTSPLMRELIRARDGYMITTEKRSLRRDGSVVWVLLSAAVVRDADGKPAYVVSMVSDISERKRSEAQLLEQLDELRRFQKVTVDRELRMLELEVQLRALKGRAAA
jgi:PAS domain S-box-containing protein